MEERNKKENMREKEMKQRRKIIETRAKREDNRGEL